MGLGCLILVALFFLFKSQFFILLTRLSKMEFRNLQTKAETIPPIDTKPWTWHKAWINSLMHPNTNTSKALLAEGNISFRQACIWIVVTSIVFQFLYSIILWIKFPYPINTTSILDFIKNCILAGLFSPISIFILTGLIHILAKIFGSKESFQNFFIVYVAFNAPVLILYIALALIWQVFRIKVALYLGMISAFYFLFTVTAKAIKSYYRFNRIKAFSINLIAQIVFFFSTMALVIMAYPNIIKR